MMDKSATDYQKRFLEAVQNCDMSSMTELLKDRPGKVNVNVFDKKTGQTPLHQGCLEGNIELIQLLIRYGADVRLANRDGWSPLHLACYTGNEKVYKYIVRMLQEG